jgi:general secretion pathway protein M
VKNVVDQSGGKLISTQSLPFSTKDEVTEVKVRVRVSGESDAIAKLMHALESEKPFLLIEKFTARSRPVTQRSNRPRRTARDRRNKTPPPVIKPPRTTYNLNVNFDVIAYLRTDAT